MAVRPSLSSAATQARAPVSVSSFRDSSPSPSPSQHAESPSSIYVTFKVLQLVNAFRNKVTRKQRAHQQASTKKPTSIHHSSDDFCQDFEKYAAAEIDKYLGRKTRHPSGRKSGGVGRATRIRPAVATEESQGVESIDGLLQRLDQSVRYGKSSLIRVAKHDRLFLERQGASNLRCLQVKELCQLLDAVKEVIRHLEQRHNIPSEGQQDDSTLDTLDEAQAANLLHLLLRLQGHLVRFLVSRLVQLVQQHVSDCQKDQSKHSEDWFFEFPDARHPQTTTFPWTIKASLVVLWGVCWMFEAHAGAPAVFDKEGNLLNERGEIELPAQAVYDYLRERQPSPQQQKQQAQMIAVNRQALSPLQAYGDPRFPRSVPLSPSVAEMESSTPAQPLLPRGGLRTSHSHHPSGHHHTARTTEQAPHTASGLAYAHTNTPVAYTTQPPPSTYAADSAWPLPQANLDLSAYGPAVDQQAWQQTQGLPVQSYPAQHAATHSHFPPQPIGQPSHLPPRQSRHPHQNPPAITTTDLSPFPLQQPEDFNDPYSAASASSHSSSIPLRQTASVPNFRNSHYDPGHLSPLSPYMDPAIQDVPDMQTTTPPRSPHGMPTGEPMTRKRSHSQISNGLAFPPAEANHSQHGSQMGDEEFEPNRMTFSRGDPMMNHNRKYICNIQGEECAHLVFDRKCEWSKHMDKHDRPYRCSDPACAKLQGFTYSGGLLRHEREVHGKHGGPKSQMMCPFPDCKRHSGKGFTRKENLNEHIRRVHHGAEHPTQPQSDLLKHDDFETLTGAARPMDDSTETPTSRVSEALLLDEELQSPATKRRKHTLMHSNDHTVSDDVEELRRHIEQLQQDNALKDQRLMELERTLAEMDRSIKEGQRAQQAQQELYDQHQQQQQQAATAAAAIATAAQQV